MAKTMPKQVKTTAKELRETGIEVFVKAVEGLADHCECFVNPDDLKKKPAEAKK